MFYDGSKTIKTNDKYYSRDRFTCWKIKFRFRLERFLKIENNNSEFIVYSTKQNKTTYNIGQTKKTGLYAESCIQ